METSSSKIYSTSWDSDLNSVAYRDLWSEPGAFTTLRLDVFKKHQCAYFKEQHIERLLTTLTTLQLSVAFNATWLSDQIDQFISSIDVQSFYNFRIMITEGICSFQATPRGEPDIYLDASLWVHSRRNPEIKSLDYSDIIQKLEGIDRNREEVILQSEDGHLLEGATTNLIFLQGNTLVTPAKRCLPGITRRILSEILSSRYQWEEHDVHVLEIEQFDEILCCGSGKGVAALKSIDTLSWAPRSQIGLRTIRTMYDNTLIDYKYR